MAVVKRLIDYDPFTGIETYHEYDPINKETRIFYEHTRDVSGAVDVCKALANDDDFTKKGIKEDWWRYAHIPNSLMLKWHVEEGIPLFDAKEYNKKANQPEYKFLKYTTKHHQ